MDGRGDSDCAIDGKVIRFMWDYGVVVPLWNAGLLPEEPEWLRTTLGLSDELIRGLTSWGNAMCALDADKRSSRQDYLDLDQTARVLVERLSLELEPRYSVVYVPWD